MVDPEDECLMLRFGDCSGGLTPCSSRNVDSLNERIPQFDLHGVGIELLWKPGSVLCSHHFFFATGHSSPYPRRTKKITPPFDDANFLFHGPESQSEEHDSDDDDSGSFDSDLNASDSEDAGETFKFALKVRFC